MIGLCVCGTAMAQTDFTLSEPDRISIINAALDAVDEESLRANFDPARMESENVYPSVWDEGEEALPWLLDAFRTLRDAYADAASKGWAMMLAMT